VPNSDPKSPSIVAVPVGIREVNGENGIPVPDAAAPSVEVPPAEPAAVPRVGAKFERFTPQGETDILRNAQDLMTAYWKAPTWQEKLVFVRGRERVAPLMRSHYEERHAGEPPAGEFHSSQFQRVGRHELLRLLYKRTDKPSALPTHVPLLKQPDGTWLLDWEAFVGACEMDWGEFIQQRRTQPTLFRTEAMESDYFNYEFTDEAKFLCLRLQSWDGGHHVFAYCERDSETGRDVKAFQLSTQKTQGRATVRVAFPENAKSGDCVQLTEFVADRWLLLE